MIGYYIFEVHFYDDDTWEDIYERGIICAGSYQEVVNKLEEWYGNQIYDLRIREVDIDTEELLLERNFPGLIELLENPKEG